MITESVSSFGWASSLWSVCRLVSARTLTAVLDSRMLWYCEITFNIQQRSNHRHVLCPQDAVWKWIEDILRTAFNRSGWMLKTQCVSAHLCASHCMKIKIVNWSLIPAGLILSYKEHNGRHFKIPPQRLVVTALITMRLQDSKHNNPVGFRFLHHSLSNPQNINEILLRLWMPPHVFVI